MKKIVSLICAILGIGIIAIVIFLMMSKSYTVSFDTDGGSFVEAQSVKKGEKVTKPSNPVKYDYSFVRWEYQNKEYDFNSSVENDMVLKAIWEKVVEEAKYSVVFKIDGKTKTVGVDDYIDEDDLELEEKSGYVIKWYLNGKEYDLTTKVSGDMTLEGKYVKSESFTVKFNSNGGSSVDSQTVNIGKKATKPSNPTKTGYIFESWLLNGKEYNFNTTIDCNITLVAKWKEDPDIKRYTVTFDSNGGSNVNKQTVIEGEKATKPSNPIKTGYTFNGWKLDNNTYNFNSAVNKDITLVADWKTGSYNVTFDCSGCDKIGRQTINPGGKVTKPSDPTKTGYKFVGWVLSNNSTYNFDKEVTSDIVLYATWEKIKYTVTFDSDGGSSVDSQTINYGGFVTEPNDPTKTGYSFNEWLLGKEKYDFSKKVTDNITLKASWIVNTYTVTFDSNGGSSVDNQTINYGEKVTKPNVPTKDGYAFNGWLLGNEKYDFNKEVIGDITLKADWKINAYTVTFDSNGGSSIDNQTINYGEKATKPSNPTKTGYTFKRWLLSNEEYNFDTKVTNNITLKADWTINTYSVTFDSNGGSSVDNQTINYGEKATKPTDPTKAGCTFNGWLLGSEKYDFDTKVTGNITLKADWTENVYTIKANLVQNFSTDATLDVYENGNVITYVNVLYNGNVVTTYGNLVNKADVEKYTSFDVTLTSGAVVNAKVVK